MRDAIGIFLQVGFIGLTHKRVMKPHPASMPSAVCIGFASSTADITPEQRAVLEALLAADTLLPQPDMNLPVPDGVVYCFNFPTRTLEFVRRLGARAQSAAVAGPTQATQPALRIGVHAAAVVRDAGASDSSVTGASIDGAMRIARLANPNQALATPAFYRLAIEMLTGGSKHFRDLGLIAGANGKPAAVFEIIPFGSKSAVPPYTDASLKTGTPPPPA